MEITILFFGACRDIAATSEKVISLPTGASVAEAFAQLKSCYPALADFESRLLFAVNEDYSDTAQILCAGDTLAILPPVSGGEVADMEDICQLTDTEIDTRQLVEKILKPHDGAVITFEGVTRNHSRNKPDVQFLEYQAYVPMALKTMREVIAEARAQWPINGVAMVHRLGRVDVSQTSVAIVVTSAHRKTAYQASQFLIDRLKEIVPIWKREYFADGAVWVDPQLQ